MTPKGGLPVRIEEVCVADGATARGRWLVGWWRVVEDDGSTVAYCPDIVTANMVMWAIINGRESSGVAAVYRERADREREEEKP